MTVRSIRQVIEDQKTAFGEVSISELTPVVQLEFPYNINLRSVTTRVNNGGTVTQSNQKAKLSTSAAANASAQMFSVVGVKYEPGEGALVRFSALFTTPAANSNQEIGIGSSSDGYYFEYNGVDFGILRRQGGTEEVRVLTISAASTTDENVTITLDGDAKTDVVVTNTNDVTLTANEIAAADYSQVGTGWSTHVMDSRVFFVSYDAAAHAGAYTLSSTSSSAGTFSQSLAGTAPTDIRVTQVNWNRDTLGAGDLNPSEVTLDQTKLNIYQIRYQWLGAGSIFFYVSNPVGGNPILVHEIEYANANTIPSVDNPTLPLCARVSNGSNTSDIIIESSSMGGFIEGRIISKGISQSKSVEVANIGLTETPILTIHSHDIFKGKTNRVRIRIKLISASVDGTKPSILRLTKNPTLTGASFSPLDSNTSTIFVDTSATALTGGDVVFVQGLAKSDSVKLTDEDIEIFIEPIEVLTLSLEATASTVDAVLSLNWEELF